jgi:HCOMODA/2-hydroxy-3-carboxy-muconic semialdehyde decarboxylase
VSARHDKHPDRFLLARNMAPGLVTADDIVTFDLDGRALNANGRAVYLERFIHAEIFRARPDVMAVVHSHSVAVVPFSILKGVPFRAVCHMGGFIGIFCHDRLVGVFLHACAGTFRKIGMRSFVGTRPA